MVTSQNGAFDTSIPLSIFTQATQPIPTHLSTLAVFTNIPTQTIMSSGGTTFTLSTNVIVPTQITSSIVDASVSYVASMTQVSVTATFQPEVSPIKFLNVIESINNYVGVQVWSAEIFEEQTGFYWILIQNGKTKEPMASNVQWKVEVFSNGLVTQETFTLLPNIGQNKQTAMLYPGQTNGQFYVSIVSRFYRQSTSARKRVYNGSLEYSDSSSLGQFQVQINSSSSTTTRASRTTTKFGQSSASKASSIKTMTFRTSTKTSVKTSAKTTKTPRPTNWIIAQTCKQGVKYNNAKNCCCAPNVTRKLTKTITIAKGAKVTGQTKRYVMSKDEIFARQVRPQHLCGSCPISRPESDVICCLPKHTVTRVVKTIYKIRSA
jgi:hypothetical protein